MRLYIITGTSQGIGASLAEQLLSTSSVVHFLSKAENPSLIKFARMRQLALYYHVTEDKSSASYQEILEKILKKENPADWQKVSLVFTSECLDSFQENGQGNRSAEIHEAFVQNSRRAVLLSEVFLRLTQEWSIEKQILLQNTQLEKKALTPWRESTEIGLGQYAKTLSEKQKQALNLLKVMSFQVEEGNISQEKLGVQLISELTGMAEKEAPSILSPELVACELVKLLKASDFGKEANVRIGDLLVD